MDKLDAVAVEITVDQFNKLWVNVDGRCVVRIGRVDEILIELPRRKPITIKGK